MVRPLFLHCPSCGARVDHKIPADDNRERAVCSACGTIHYQNPLMVVGTVPTFENQVLLCKRAIEPRRGYWTLPAGFLELGESTSDGALRETVEEAGARIQIGPLFTVLNVVRVGQVHLFYRATLDDDRFAPGVESLEATLFDEADIPWDALAFRTVSHTLTLYFEDRKRGAFETHHGDIV